MSYDVLVIGGGPAGLSAAINVRARGRSALVVSNPLEENPLWRAEKVDNYLGLPGRSGAELLTAMRRHAEQAGAEFLAGKVLSALQMPDAWYVSVGPDMYNARAVVLAAGVARGRKFPGEAELLGRGVSYCATCDGMLYRGRAVAVAGFSDTARQEAEFLQKIGCSVTQAVRDPGHGPGGIHHLRRPDRPGGGRVHPPAHHGPHGAVPGPGGGAGLCDGGPAHGHQPPRPLRRRRLHRRSAPGLQGCRRRTHRRAERRGLGGRPGAGRKTEVTGNDQICDHKGDMTYGDQAFQDCGI